MEEANGIWDWVRSRQGRILIAVAAVSSVRVEAVLDDRVILVSPATGDRRAVLRQDIEAVWYHLRQFGAVSQAEMPALGYDLGESGVAGYLVSLLADAPGVEWRDEHGAVALRFLGNGSAQETARNGATRHESNLGMRLRSLRRDILATGAPQLSWDDLDNEVAERRGER